MTNRDEDVKNGDIGFETNGAAGNGSGEGSRQPSQSPRPTEQGTVHHHYYYPVQPHYQQHQGYRPQPQKSGKPSMAGALLIITGVLGLTFALGGGFIGSFMTGLENPDGVGTIRGTIYDQNGNPLDNVTVTVVGHSGLSDQSDGNGFYLLTGVPAGNSEIMAEKDGYVTLIKRTYIASNEIPFNFEGSQWNGTQSLDLVLTSGSGTVTSGSYPPFGALTSIFWVCLVVVAVMSVITIVGGIYCLKRGNWSMALVGTICGIFTIGFGIGTILAFVTLFILLQSKDEFDLDSSADRESGGHEAV